MNRGANRKLKNWLNIVKLVIYTLGEIVLTIGTDGYGETTIFYLQYLKEIQQDIS